MQAPDGSWQPILDVEWPRARPLAEKAVGALRKLPAPEQVKRVVAARAALINCGEPNALEVLDRGPS